MQTWQRGTGDATARRQCVPLPSQNSLAALQGRQDCPSTCHPLSQLRHGRERRCGVSSQRCTTANRKWLLRPRWRARTKYADHAREKKVRAWFEMLLLLPSSMMLFAAATHKHSNSRHNEPSLPSPSHGSSPHFSPHNSTLSPPLAQATTSRPMSSPARPSHSISLRCFDLSSHCAAGLDHSAVEFTASAAGAWQASRSCPASVFLSPSIPDPHTSHTFTQKVSMNADDARELPSIVFTWTIIPRPHVFQPLHTRRCSCWSHTQMHSTPRARRGVCSQ
jgi:hypothetical protein